MSGELERSIKQNIFYVRDSQSTFNDYVLKWQTVMRIFAEAKKDLLRAAKLYLDEDMEMYKVIVRWFGE